MRANSTEMFFSIRNLCALNLLTLDMIGCTIDDHFITSLFNQVQNIEKLILCGTFSYFNIDSLVNLKFLSLDGTINESFNIELFKNLCNQLDSLKVDLKKIDEKTFLKLFDGHNFSKLLKLSIINCNLNILKKEFTNRFPILRKLFIIGCNLKVIENDAFSNLKQIWCLDLSQNRLKFIEKDTFSNLDKLRKLDLSKNEFTTYIDRKFIGVVYSIKLLLENEEFATLKRCWPNY